MLGGQPGGQVVCFLPAQKFNSPTEKNKMRQQTCFMAVQVVRRDPDGTLREWYDGDRRAVEADAKLDAIDNSKRYPNTPFQVVEMRITEVGKQYKT